MAAGAGVASLDPVVGVALGAAVAPGAGVASLDPVVGVALPVAGAAVALGAALAPGAGVALSGAVSVLPGFRRGRRRIGAAGQEQKRDQKHQREGQEARHKSHESSHFLFPLNLYR